MPSRIFNNILNEQISVFKNSFSDESRKVFVDSSGKLIHPGEFGMYREQVCRNFLRFFIPSNYEIETGFLITDNDRVSRQCDIIIFDPSFTPLIRNDGLQRFFPIETTIAVGEIKSILTKSDFFDSLLNLSNLKKFRQDITNPIIIRDNRHPVASRRFDTHKYSFDQIITFLICDKLNFDTRDINNEIAKLYDSREIHFSLRHNAILSIKDGILIYYDQDSKSNFYPFMENTYLKNRFLLMSESNTYIRFFCNAFFVAASSTTVLYPELANYMEFMSKLEYTDQSIHSSYFE